MNGRDMRVEPFTVRISDSALLDLRERLSRTSWPGAIPGSGWSYGPDMNYMHVIRDYWMNGFDWRRREAEWNRLPHFLFESDGMRIHFIHVRGRGPNPLPILITHGWPGSFIEMLKLVPLLSDPQQFGGDPGDAFDVIVPSLPGFGFSDKPDRPGCNTFKIAEIWASLMQELGYQKFVAQGGDFGANVSSVLAWKYRDRVDAFHLNYIPGSYRPYVDAERAPMTEEENGFQVDNERWGEEKGGYAHVQRTQPQALAMALNDSPMGLASWIVDKFRDWADCDGDVERRFSKDELLANVALYWLTETIGSSMRLYYESRKAPLQFGKDERIHVPCAVARFPKEEPFPPRSWVERVYDVRRWTEMPKGGHFAAAEEPELLAQDIREFFRQFRKTS